MAQPLKGGLPPDLHMAAGYRIRLLAIDPTTGATVNGVNLNTIAFYVTDLLDVGTGGGDGNPPMPLLVPSDSTG